MEQARVWILEWEPCWLVIMKQVLDSCVSVGPESLDMVVCDLYH